MMLEHFGSRASSPLKLWTYEYKLPQLSPVDACERQGSRMGNTQCPPFSRSLAFAHIYWAQLRKLPTQLMEISQVSLKFMSRVACAK